MQKIMAFVTMLNGVDRGFDVASALLMLGLALLAWDWSGRKWVEPRLGCAAAIVTLAAIVIPSNVMESWGADMRMIPVAIMLVILSIRPATTPRREQALMLAGLALFLARDAATLAVWRARSGPLEARLGLLAGVPAGSRLGYVSAETNCRTPWPIRPDHVLAAYAVIRNDAFVNTMFHNKGADIMSPRRPIDAARWVAASQDIKAVCPQGTVDKAAVTATMAGMAADGFDRIWLTGAPAEAFPLPAGFGIAARVGGDTLYMRRRGK